MAEADQNKPQNLETLLDELEQAADGKDKVPLKDVHEAIGERSFGPLLLAAGLAALTPLGVIPGLPTAFAIIVVLIAGQLVIGRDRFWIPRRLREHSVGADRLNKAVSWLRKPARVIDRFVKPRLRVFTQAGFTRVVAVICVVIAFAIPPLELLPFAVVAPASAIAAFGLGLTARDGLLVLIALIASTISLALLGMVLLQ
ncbi:exopolysaccharide biosynthesis protein [Brevundimonas sp. PAMC22021]|uniref:exopolysaccharide biosynthesis protein n=1 Tax=Brevundimonas sp. PAMC22021 TaxID=2861285 RepID=UPI001C633AF0|nr:exopolysaccharide biosynthesis protein [Brevundimonas sp. PAMC22021]QYF85807.1 exopolysaccharide biosynthesis protein [Brevundimonas sp. PAMC22021]